MGKLKACSECKTREEHAFHLHIDAMDEELGKKATKNANVGWGVSEGKSDIDISSKVYGRGVFRSIVYYPSFEAEHTFEPFDR